MQDVSSQTSFDLIVQDEILGEHGRGFVEVSFLFVLAPARKFRSTKSERRDNHAAAPKNALKSKQPHL
jgi:hypothetical protein